MKTLSDFFQRAYSDEYNCDTNVTPRECDPCGEQIELGGLRDAAIIREDHVWSDPTDSTEWDDGILAGTIIMINTVKGTCDGGAPKVIPGYGSQKELLLGYDYTANVSDPAYKTNYPFWNTARKSKRWKFAYFTDTLVHLTDEVVTIKPKNPVEEGLDSIVEWRAEIVWFQKELVAFHDASNLATIRSCTNF